MLALCTTYLSQVMTYYFLATILPLGSLVVIRQVYSGVDQIKLATETGSALMFIIWTIVLYKRLHISASIIFMLMAYRELFDFIWIFIVNKKQFTQAYKNLS